MSFTDKQPVSSHYSQLHSYGSSGQSVPRSANQPRMSGILEEDESITNMTDNDLAARTGRLARLSRALSIRLNHVEEACGHEATKQEIHGVANELTLLASTLRRMQEAIKQEPNHYTLAFHHDLNSILDELKLCFDEVGECCGEMCENDDPENAVPWFFTKGRVARMSRHLAALKATLVTMRTVLWDGKENAKGIYGHALSNQRYIIESTFSRNKNAILDISALEPRDAANNAYHRTSVDRPNDAQQDIQDSDQGTQAAVSEASKDKDRTEKSEGLTKELVRRFTNRAQPAIHDSFLNIRTADSISRLNEMWIQPEARYHEIFVPTTSSFDASYSQSTIEVSEGFGDLDTGALAPGLPATTIGVTTEHEGFEPVRHRNILMNTALGRSLRRSFRKLIKPKQNTVEAQVIRPRKRKGPVTRFFRIMWGMSSHSSIHSSDWEDTENMQSGLA